MSTYQKTNAVLPLGAPVELELIFEVSTNAAPLE
jgi:hypothetical protein